MSETTRRYLPPDDDSGSRGSSLPPSPLGSSVGSRRPTTGPAQFSTDPNIAPDEPTVVGANPLSSGAALPPTVPTSGDLGKMLEGERLGHFFLEEFIGGGGMGAVFRGTDEMLGRTVAIKVLAPHQGADEETTRRFRHEAQSTARLDHENIARVYYVGVDRGWHYIVLEYVEGENLRDLVAIEGPLPLADVIGFTLQITEALDHASSRDVVHRDIKPSNVLITKAKQAKLVDMGLARLHQVEHPEDDLTASGVTLGTFDYISPEQARDPRNADVRSDLYSLGCTVYFMLTGRPPFPQGTVLQKLLQHQGDAPPDPRRFRPDVPEAICRVTNKLLAKDPAHRYQRPLELFHELVAISRQLEFPLSQEVGETWVPQKTRSRRSIYRHLPWAVPVGILALVVVFVYARELLRAEIPPPWDDMPRRPSATSNRAATGEPGSPERPATGGTGTSPSGAASGGEPGGDRRGGVAARSRDLAVDRSEAPRRTLDPESDGDGADGDGADAASLPAGEDVGSTTDAAKPPSTSNGPRPTIVGVGESADHRSLGAALRAADTSATIELRYDGRGLPFEDAIELDQRLVTIRGGEGYSPVVRFRPRAVANGTDAVMIALRGGRLTLVNLHLELELPAASSAVRYALFESIAAERIEMKGCTITVRDRRENLREFDYRPTIVRASRAPYRGLIDERPREAASELAWMLKNCVVRGPASFLSGAAVGAVDLNWQNGLLAIDDRFVLMGADAGSESARGQLRVHLDHVTANCRRGFVLMSGGDDARYFPRLNLRAVDSLLISDGAPLIEQRGWQSREQLQEAVRWSGHNNGFDGFEVFWQLEPSLASTKIRYRWTDWQDYWPRGTENSFVGVRWQDAGRLAGAIWRHRPKDYTLRDDDNPAISGATDGMSDMGLVTGELPPLPWDGGPRGE